VAGKHSKKKTKPALRSKSGASPVRSEVMWDWFDVLLISITLVLAFFASSTIVRSALAQLLPGSGQAMLRLILVLVFYVIEILVVVYIAHRHNFKFFTLYRLRAAKDDLETPLQWVTDLATSTISVLLLLILTQGLSMLWSYVTAQQGWTPTSTNDLLTMFGTSTASRALAVLCVVVLAPFIEEIIFRGVFLSTFATMMAPALAVLITALLFAVYHASLWAFVPHVILGIALGALALRCKTLWPAIALHALYNAVLMAAAFYLTF